MVTCGKCSWDGSPKELGLVEESASSRRSSYDDGDDYVIFCFCPECNNKIGYTYDPKISNEDDLFYL